MRQPDARLGRQKGQEGMNLFKIAGEIFRNVTARSLPLSHLACPSGPSQMFSGDGCEWFLDKGLSSVQSDEQADSSSTTACLGAGWGKFVLNKKSACAIWRRH